MHAEDLQLLARLARGFGQLVAKMSPTSGQVHVPAPGREQRLRKGVDDPNPALNNLEVELADPPLSEPLEENEEEESQEGDPDAGGRAEPGAVEKDDGTDVFGRRRGRTGGVRGDVDKSGEPPRRVATVALRHGDHLLMGKRRDNGRYTVPGGHLDDGETFAEGALREVEEETGVKLDPEVLEELADVMKKVDAEGRPLHVQPFQVQLDERPATTMKEDPDAEVHRWHWVDVSDGLPEEIAQNLHVPLKHNVLMAALGMVPEDEPALLMLDLGSGTEREDGHVGIDLYPYDDQTQVHDLNLGIPHEDASVVHVHMRNAFHEMELDDREALLEEICRVLCDGGVFTYEGPAELGMPEGMTEMEHAEGVAKESPGGDPPSPTWHKQVFVRHVGPDPAHPDDHGWPEPFGAQDGLSAAARAADSYAAETVTKVGNENSGRYPRGSGGAKKPGDLVRGSPLSHTQQVALSDYKRRGYEVVNSYLRDPKAATVFSDAGHRPATDREIKQAQGDVKKIDSAIAKSSLKEDVTVYRGFQHEDMARNPDAYVGQEVTEKGYLSTTTNPGYSSFHAGVGQHPVKMEIKASKGTPALNMEQFSDVYSGENEVLFGRNSRVKITSFTKDASGVTFHAEMLPQQSGVKKSSPVVFERTVEIVRKAKDQQIVYCVVLSPNESDEHEDFMLPEDIEAVAHRFMQESRIIGAEHTKAIKACPVESYVAPQDFTWEGQNGPQKVKKGSWIIGIKVYDKGEWQKILDGDYSGVSISGVGEREDMVA